MIGIITSGTENYNLIKLCQQYDLRYIIIADTHYWPYQDRDDETLIKRFALLSSKAKETGATHILTSPRLELLHQDQETVLPIIPLFTSYLQYAYDHSLIGKIGYFGGYCDVDLINRLHKNLASNHILTDRQRTTKKFLTPLAKWTKDTSMRAFFLRIFSTRNMMINKVIKFDLRYFKDANVDTLIPLDYSYFNYQKTIVSFFNRKKQKFHKREILQQLFKTCIEDIQPQPQSQVTIVYSGSDHLINHKKRSTTLSNGGKYTIVYQKLETLENKPLL